MLPQGAPGRRVGARHHPPGSCASEMHSAGKFVKDIAVWPMQAALSMERQM